MAGLDALIPPEPVLVPVRGGAATVAVREITLRQMPDFIRALVPALPLLGEGRRGAALIHHPDALMAAAAIATGLTADEVADLPAADGMAVIAAVIDRCVDFLLWAQMAAPRPGVEPPAPTTPPPSPGSPGADTGSERSST